MITLAPLLVAASAAIILLLGLIHLLYTFRGPKLHPRDAVGLFLLAGYVFLGKVYWFSVPFRGIVLSTALYVAALVIKWA